MKTKIKELNKLKLMNIGDIMKNMGMKSLKRILLATFIIFSVMTINVNSATMSRIGDISDTKVTDTDYLTIANTKIYDVDYWLAPFINIINVQSVVDGECNGNQINPCGIVVNYNISP